MVRWYGPFMLAGVVSLVSGQAAARVKPAASTPAPSPGQGAALYQAKLCGTCHGERGQQPIAALYPKLAGQSAAYLVAQTLDIIDGKRSNGQTAVMKVSLASVSLSASELEAIAQWLAGQGS